MESMFAREFTPELSQDYLASLLNNVDQEEQTSIGKARQEGASAGLIGQAATGSRIGAAEQNANLNRNATISKFNLDVADKQYGERMTDEQRTFQDVERQKQDDFQKSLAEMGYQFSDSQRAIEEHDKNLITGSSLLGLAAGAGAQGAGSYFGSKAGAAAVAA